jgi:DNA-binding NtrC family response regulator
MFEDALFGHVRGAFTGAQSDVPGYLLEADKGTLFLDEIGALGFAVQAKLLRVIETKCFRPVGARSDRRSDFRIVSAANEQLSELIPQGRFREDLLFRLNGVLIELPALNDRREDIPDLARHFASREAGDTSPVIEYDALEILMAHDWPGNVRELRAVVERAVMLSDNASIGRRELAQAMALSVGQASARRRRNRSDFATQRLLSVLRETDGNVGAAAALLGVHRTTVYRRLVRAGVHGWWVKADADLTIKGELGALPGAERRSE